MIDLRQKIGQLVRLRKLCAQGQSIVLAVSGGPDSMALLDLLAFHARANRWKLSVAHLNHQLRGRHSDADEQFVRQAAAARGLPCFAESAEVRTFAKQTKLSVEMAARTLRHRFLARVAVEQKAGTIALAHHADDQVELFFLRLLRGSGGLGLAGMRWSSPSPANQEIDLIRPLLSTSKAEILEYAARFGLTFRVDKSNRSPEHLRNRIRCELIPQLLKYQPGLMRTVPRLMEILGAEGDYLAGQARDWLSGPRRAFERLPVALQRRCLELQSIEQGLEPDFELIEKLREKPQKRVSLGTGRSILRTARGELAVSNLGIQTFKKDRGLLDLGNSEGEAWFANKRFRWRIEPCRSVAMPIPKSGAKRRQEVFDAGKIGRHIVLRHWQPGDRFHPIGAKTALKLQDFLTNEKVPRKVRHDLVVAATENGQIFWVEGLRISELFKLDSGTRSKLKWSWRG